MALYEFKGVNKKGRNVHGTVEADTEGAARSQIKKSNIYIVDLKRKVQKKSGLSLFSGSQKIDAKVLATTTRNLATMIKSGVPLVDALATLIKQTDHPVMSEVLTHVKNSVNEGRSLHQSLSHFPGIFNKTYVAMCKAGEASGTLDLILNQLAQFTEAQTQLNNKVRSALVYPTIMSVFSIFMIIFLLTYVVPKVRVLFEDAGQDSTIPWYSAFLLDMSDFIVQYWESFTFGIVIIIFLTWRWKKSAHGTKAWNRISLKLPIFGKLIRSVAISRFSRTLSTLLRGGVPVIDSLDIVKNVVNNYEISRYIEKSKHAISRGESLSISLEQSQHFPPMVTQMIRVGEKTGQLEHMLTQISNSYDNQIKTDIDTITSLLEPIMLILMGGVIAFIVFSTLIPLMQIYNLEGITG